ncbi:DNA integrity scanning diadenylate cyclase DisA [Candidatus Pacearchaeota archaeon]|nr:DNA integrity scanning diadenylate cyclase DisA [Candidatus Pacearchaeota archaeon]
MQEILNGISKKIASKDKDDFINVLKMFSPGTSIRSALDDILRARMGALIAIDAPELSKILEGGFKVNCKFSSQKLVELAKMDGAIILSKDLKKILYANTLLFPSISISTKETGTRHKAAERTANQIKTIVIAVSERKNKITIYYKHVKYELEISSEVLRRAAETLQILEKQKDILNDIMININILEINNLVTISDVCEVLQRMEMIRRISDVVKRYLVELGKEGNIMSMRLKELTKNLNKERQMVLMDYFQSKYSHPDNILKNIDFDTLLEVSNLSKILFEEVHDKSIFPRGIRILSKTNLSSKDIKSLINNFKVFNQIFNAEVDSLMNVLKNKDVVNSLVQDLDVLKEKILIGKKF